jgi:hypothetical protein
MMVAAPFPTFPFLFSSCNASLDSRNPSMTAPRLYYEPPAPRAIPIYTISVHIIESHAPNIKWTNPPKHRREPGPFTALLEHNTLNWGTGFPPNLPNPELRITWKKPKTPALADAYYNNGEFWIVSALLKDTLISVAPNSFDYVPCRVSWADGAPAPEMYMADVVRWAETIDVDFHRSAGDEIINGILQGARSILFHRTKCEELLIWRDPLYSSVLCTPTFWNAISSQTLIGPYVTHVGWAV